MSVNYRVGPVDAEAGAFPVHWEKQGKAISWQDNEGMRLGRQCPTDTVGFVEGFDCYSKNRKTVKAYNLWHNEKHFSSLC